MLCWFLPHISMNPPSVHTCPLPLEPPSHLPPHCAPLGCHRAPGWTPCAMHQLRKDFLTWDENQGGQDLKGQVYKQSSTHFQEPDVWHRMDLTSKWLNRCFTLSLLTFRSSHQTPWLGYLSNTLGWHPLCLPLFSTRSQQVRLSSQIHFIVQDYCLVHSGLDGTQIP